VSSMNPARRPRAGWRHRLSALACSAALAPGNPATDFSCTATSCTATAPPEPAGTVNVQVTTPVGTSAADSANQYTYTRRIA
jgi:hypothetical protein